MKPFIKYLRAQLGMPYVWGGQGDLLTGLHDPEKWIKSQESNADNRKRAIDFFRKCKEAGMETIRAFDCSGLIMYWLQDLYGIMGDRSAQMLYNQSAKVSREELQEGDLVFKGSAPDNITHVGVYVGGGRVIESKGRDDGVCETELASRPFKYFGRLSALAPFLIDEPEEPAQEEYPDAPLPLTVCKPALSGEGYRVFQHAANLLGYKDADGGTLAEDGKFGKRSRQAFDAMIAINLGDVSAKLDVRIEGVGDIAFNAERKGGGNA